MKKQGKNQKITCKLCGSGGRKLSVYGEIIRQWFLYGGCGVDIFRSMRLVGLVSHLSFFESLRALYLETGGGDGL